MGIDNEKKFDEPLKVILKEMCRRVGTDFNKIDFEDNEDPWFMKYEWTDKEQDEFKDWLINYLDNNKEAREEIMEIPSKNKKRIKEVVNMFILNYGWKLKN